jgi:TRAP-type C4-dicarboxylate transport system permease small subunit
MGLISRMAIKFSHVLDIFARWLWMSLMLLVVGNVILRVLGYPIRGTFELVEFLTALAVGLSLANCAAQGGHVAATFLIDKLSEKAQIIANILIEMVILSFLALVFWRINIYATTIRLTGQVSQTTEIAYYPIIHLIAAGFLAYFLVTLGSLIDNVRKAVHK